jgi:hypothetical protein
MGNIAKRTRSVTRTGISASDADVSLPLPAAPDDTYVSC